jgi:hypothetical protein
MCRVGSVGRRSLRKPSVAEPHNSVSRGSPVVQLDRPRHFQPGRFPMYRISRDGQKSITDVDTADELEPAIQASRPGRYHIDELSRDPRRLATLR